MKKCKWTECAEPAVQDFIQIYEFVRVPYSEVTEIRIYFDIGQEEFFRYRKYRDGRMEWWKTSPLNVDEV